MALKIWFPRVASKTPSLESRAALGGTKAQRWTKDPGCGSGAHRRIWRPGGRLKGPEVSPGWKPPVDLASPPHIVQSVPFEHQQDPHPKLKTSTREADMFAIS